MEAYREEIAKLKAENEVLRQKKETTKSSKPKTKEDFIFFAEYNDNLKYKLKILMLPYNKKKTTKRTFEKVKLRIVFNTI